MGPERQRRQPQPMMYQTPPNLAVAARQLLLFRGSRANPSTRPRLIRHAQVMVHRPQRRRMPPGWMHITDDGDPLLQKLAARLPGDLTDDERSAVLAEATADEELFTRVVNLLAGRLLDWVPDNASWVETSHNHFRRRLRWAWSRPLDLYLAVHRYVDTLGEEFNGTYRASSDLPVPLLDAMTKNFARACLTSNEVYALLENGYRSGALARARTLHELDVVSLTLAMHPDLAERYLLHHHIERYQLAKADNDACIAGGIEGIPDEDLENLRLTHDELIERFGGGYKQPWGWAAPILGGKNGFSPLFKKVTSEVANPQYQYVSHMAHATSLGGELATTMTEFGEQLNTGPDLEGLAAPFDLALASLVSIATRTIHEATGSALSQYGRIGLGALYEVAEEAIASAWETEHKMEQLAEEFAPFDRLRDWWLFKARREFRFRWWQTSRLARARTEGLRRFLSDARGALKP